MISSLVSGEEVKHLRKRVDALESVAGVASARSSRLSSSGVNIIDPLDASYIDRSSAGSTITRAENGINLGAAVPGGGAQDSAALHRTVQQWVRAELRSDSLRGEETQTY